MLKDIFVFFVFGYKYAFQVKENESLGEYLKRCKFSEEFVNDHLIPMSSAIWSCPEKEILNFPAKTLLTFFKNHQLINFIFLWDITIPVALYQKNQQYLCRQC